MKLENKRIVIVGGSSGMGLAAAKNLAEAGANVLVASRSAEKLARAKAEIGKLIETRVLDVREEQEVANFFRSVGAFDHLVIAAADAVLGPFLDLDIRIAQDFFNSKFWGAYRVARYGAPHLSKDGSITFFSGAASQRGTPGLSAGSAINAALEALGRTLAVELAPIRVNTIAPGLIDTPVWLDIMGEEQKQAFFKEVAARLPLKRIGKVEEVAHTVRYLIENTYTTGSVIFPDGGYLQV
jgi:NAD(P)-dependent dehydrogenase (short-subunit alcohol dehydrogenase family)